MELQIVHADTYSEEATMLGEMLTIMWDRLSEEDQDAIKSFLQDTARLPSQNN